VRNLTNCSKVKWLHYDRLGSVMNKSGSAGTLTDTYHQDAYGNVLSNVNTGQWASSMSGRHLTTKEYDGDANLYYFWQRWYDPRVGRFISQDEIPVANLYAYVGNRPTGRIDPSGAVVGEPSGRTKRKNWPFPYPGGGICAINAFIRNYRNMRDANVIGADKYFHCLAHCEAKKCGLTGEQVGRLLGEIRELIDWITGDPEEDSAADRAANQHGLAVGKNCKCKDHCGKYRPRALPEKY